MNSAILLLLVFRQSIKDVPPFGSEFIVTEDGVGDIIAETGEPLVTE